MNNRFLSVVAAAAFAATASAQSPWISEVFVNAPGTDQGQEFFEITGPPGFSLGAHYLISIDGDGAAAGVVDQVLNLNTFVLGLNGVFVWYDAAPNYIPAASPLSSSNIADFSPDLENGSNTFILGFGTPPTVGTDLDTNNDGTLDVPLTGFTVVDAVSIVENDGAANYPYCDDVGFAGGVCGPFGYTPDAVWRMTNCDFTPGIWVGGDVLGTNPAGPYLWESPVEVFGWGTGLLPPGLFRGVDPGNFNPCTPTQVMTQPSGPGSVHLGVTGGTGSSVYISAYTFNLGNAPILPATTPPYSGIFGGLVIDVQEFLDEFYSFSPPFYGFTDPTGTAVGLVLPAGFVPPIGLTLYGMTILLDPGFTTVLGQTRIESLAL